jgi:hypothetical protein
LKFRASYLFGLFMSVLSAEGLAQYQYEADVYYHVPQMPRHWGGACFPHLSSEALIAQQVVYEGFKKQAKDKKRAAVVSAPVELGKHKVNGKPFEYGFVWTYRLMGPGGVVAHDSGSGSNDVIRAVVVCYDKASKAVLSRMDETHVVARCNAGTPKPGTQEEKMKLLGDCNYSVKKPTLGDFVQKQ